MRSTYVLPSSPRVVVMLSPADASIWKSGLTGNDEGVFLGAWRNSPDSTVNVPEYRRRSPTESEPSPRFTIRAPLPRPYVTEPTEIDSPDATSKTFVVPKKLFLVAYSVEGAATA